MESFYKAQGKIDADREILAEKRKEKNRLKNQLQMLETQQEENLESLSCSINAEKIKLDGIKIYKKLFLGHSV